MNENFTKYNPDIKVSHDINLGEITESLFLKKLDDATKESMNILSLSNYCPKIGVNFVESFKSYLKMDKVLRDSLDFPLKDVFQSVFLNPDYKFCWYSIIFFPSDENSNSSRFSDVMPENLMMVNNSCVMLIRLYLDFKNYRTPSEPERSTLFDAIIYWDGASFKICFPVVRNFVNPKTGKPFGFEKESEYPFTVKFQPSDKGIMTQEIHNSQDLSKLRDRFTFSGTNNMAYYKEELERKPSFRHPSVDYNKRKIWVEFKNK